MAWTFQSLIDMDMTVTAYCHRSLCHHNQRLDLKKLRDKFGPDAPAMHDDLAPKLRCTKCGGNKVGLIYSPDTSKPSGWVNPYIKAKGG